MAHQTNSTIVIKYKVRNNLNEFFTTQSDSRNADSSEEVPLSEGEESPKLSAKKKTGVRMGKRLRRLSNSNMVIDSNSSSSPLVSSDEETFQSGKKRA